jgi:hypothetical protein
VRRLAMPTPPPRKSSAARKSTTKKRATKKKAPTKRTSASGVRPGQGAVLKVGMDQVALGATASRTKVGNELGLAGVAKKSLLEVAQSLKIVDSGKPHETRILARMAGTPQEDELRTAILDALTAKREIKYFCGIEDPSVVDDVHCHIHIDQNTTVVEFVPGLAH